jgi:hypothetical protein
MTLYSIFEKPQGKTAKERARPATPPVAVPDRFSWLAALLPPVFAVLHGLWLVGVFWVALVLGLAYISRVIGTDAATWIYILVALFMGFEAPAFRRDALLARGYLWRGDMVSSGADIAERDFLAQQK